MSGYPAHNESSKSHFRKLTAIKINLSLNCGILQPEWQMHLSFILEKFEKKCQFNFSLSCSNFVLLAFFYVFMLFSLIRLI